MSAFGGKADIPLAVHMSAFDPKRTSDLINLRQIARWFPSQSASLEPCIRCVFQSQANEAARVHPRSLAVRRQRGRLWHTPRAGLMPLIGVLMNRVENDPEGQARLAAFLQGLQASGWDVSRNVRVETRWGADDVELERKYAAELIALSPDIMLAAGTLGVSAVAGLQPHPSNCIRGCQSIPSVRALSTPYPGPAGSLTGFMIL